MKPIQPTAAPHLHCDYTAVPVDTEVKTTEGKVVTRYFAKEDITCKAIYETFTCKAGDELFGRYTAKGLTAEDGYGLTVRDLIPWEKVETKYFMKVTERVTTTWEIIEKK
jgi:hypothetical protein